MDLTGIENEAEFFPSGTLSDVLKEELQDITARWAALDRSANPVERLVRVAAPTAEALRQIRNSSDRSRRAELVRDAHHALITALGFAWRREGAYTAIDGAPVIPLVSRAADATGRDALWVIEAPIPASEDEASDPVGACFTADQLPQDMREAALLDRTIESVLADGVFELSDGPRHVLVLGLSQLVLIDKRKWPARSVLRFDLQEIFSRADRDTLTVMACLISREARVPEQGAPISDRLEEEAQRNANAVTTSLKRTVRDAIELLGQEVIAVTGGKYPSNFTDASRRGVWIDGPELSRECLRYMYRLLFLFYAEANPRLNLLDMRNPIYATGYSLEALRELESVPLRMTTDREGGFLWESLQRTLNLLYTGLDLADAERGTGLRLPAVKVSLLDPDSTPLLNGLRLRNEAIQQVIRLLSLRSTGKSTGRISYAKLGIGQLGAVYETLISFTGVVAKVDLIELKPRKGRSGDAAEDGDEAEAPDQDDDAEESILEGEDAEQEDDFRRDKVDKLAPSWFVPRTRIGEFAPEEILFNGSEALIYPKGTFIYRLAGRDREKSASYYTPEPLARLLVKHALMERCRDLTADELLGLKILEPAMGSAAFLVETTNQLADLYLERKQKEMGRTIPQEDIVLEKQRVRAYIADRNCFGVDLNPIAVELGAISLWLNSLHGSDFSPWFGDQLHAGNSLIGARRAAYAPSLLGAKSDLWFNEKPGEIGWRNRLPEGHVWQWLLPAKDMSNFDKDKSIAPFAKSAQDQIKAWRKDGFFKKLEPHEIKLVQKLSRIAEALFDQVAEDLAKTRAAANDEITLWPNKTMPGNKRMDFQAKEKLNAHLIGADHAANTLPYKRLKTAMDAWCALWLWPLDKADLLPNRAEFLQGMAMILEGGFTADGGLAAPSVAEFADPAPDFLELLEPDAPARDLFKAASKRQDTLFRETNVEALIENFDWLKTAVEVAERERFVHFDLIFADVMKARGGFDVIVGNPPWAKQEWSDRIALAEIDPRWAIRQLTAAQAAMARKEALGISRLSADRYFAEFCSVKGQMAFTASACNQPYSGAGAKNLYRSFVDLTFRCTGFKGVAALIHQDGHLSSAKPNELRRAWYRRIRRHFEFSNEISTKNFAEVLHTRRFSLNIYGSGQDADVNFLQFTNAFTAAQIEDSFSHDGTGVVPGIKMYGKWSTSGHAARIYQVDLDFLKATSSASGGSEFEAIDAPLFQVLSKKQAELLVVLAKAQRVPQSKLPQFSPLLIQGEAEKLGLIERGSFWVSQSERVFLSGPMFYCHTPFYKTPRQICNAPQHYDPISLDLITEHYQPRQPFKILDLNGLEEMLSHALPNFDAKLVDSFRVVFRRRVDAGSERTFVSAIIPPGTLHVHQVTSACFENLRDLVSAACVWNTVFSDFWVKSLRLSDVLPTTVSEMPWAKACDNAVYRALILNCVSPKFASLWNALLGDLSVESSANYSLGLESPLLASPRDSWSSNVFLRSFYSRRIAQIEIDVLVGQTLGLSLEHLLQSLLSFPILMQNEENTFCDQLGNIVYTEAAGFEKVGYLDGNGNKIARRDWDRIFLAPPPELTCTAFDDTMPGDPRKVARHFVGPFIKCDRIEDYRRAWAHFERLKSEGAA